MATQKPFSLLKHRSLTPWWTQLNHAEKNVARIEQTCRGPGDNEIVSTIVSSEVDVRDSLSDAEAK